jgi:transposase
MGKTNAKDATVIANQVRRRHDLSVPREDDEQAIELGILTDRRSHLNADRTRRFNRLHGQITSIFPAFKRMLDCRPADTADWTPAPPATDRKRLETWLRTRYVCVPAALATAALEAAEPSTHLTGEKTNAQVIHTLTKEVTGLNEQITGD